MLKIMKTINLKAQAFSLIELSIAMAVVGVLAAATVPVAVRSIEIKAAEKTVLEMVLIQEAARNFYVRTNNWPLDLIQMQTQGYLDPNWKFLNPWQGLYSVQVVNQQLFKVMARQVPADLRKTVIARLPQGVEEANGDVSSVVTAPGLSAGVARGVIVAWSGAIADIPKGWALCDGEIHEGVRTVDLRDKFIVGARQDDKGAAKSNITGVLTVQGGSVNHNHGGNTGSHAITVAEMPSHQHASWGEAFPEMAPWGTTGGRGELGASNSDRDNYFYNTSPTGGNQGHSHSIASESHLPPYYALAFIMKL